MPLNKRNQTKPSEEMHKMSAHQLPLYYQSVGTYYGFNRLQISTYQKIAKLSTHPSTSFMVWLQLL